MHWLNVHIQQADVSWFDKPSSLNSANANPSWLVASKVLVCQKLWPADHVILECGKQLCSVDGKRKKKENCFFLISKNVSPAHKHQYNS